jgi:hypothetical protein
MREFRAIKAHFRAQFKDRILSGENICLYFFLMVALHWDEYSQSKLRMSPLVHPSGSIITTKKMAYHLIHSLRKQLLSSTGRRHGWCCLVCSHLPQDFVIQRHYKGI